MSSFKWLIFIIPLLFLMPGCEEENHHRHHDDHDGYGYDDPAYNVVSIYVYNKSSITIYPTINGTTYRIWPGDREYSEFYGSLTISAPGLGEITWYRGSHTVVVEDSSVGLIYEID